MCDLLLGGAIERSKNTKTTPFVSNKKLFGINLKKF